MRCQVNRSAKIKPIEDFLKTLDKQYAQYVGIATDEPERLERAKGKGQISLLEKYGYTEQMAYDLCEKYGMLSPVYEFTNRGGLLVLPECEEARTEEFEEQPPRPMATPPGFGGRTKPDREDMEFTGEKEHPHDGGTVQAGGCTDDDLGLPEAERAYRNIGGELTQEQSTESEEKQMGEYFTLTARRCKQCGRILVSEESVKRGYGCQCARKARQAELAREPVPGQIGLFDFLKQQTESEE